MPILRSRRYRHTPSDLTVSLVAFRLRQEWFAVSVESVVKVIPLDAVYGDPQGTGISLTHYQNREILVIDVGNRIFGEYPAINPESNLKQRYLVIFQLADRELVGLPIDSPPGIQRVPQSALTTIPKTYLRSGNIRCLSSTMVQLSDRSPLFMLDLEQLIRQSNG